MADEAPMTLVERLRARLHKRPFEPFTVVTTDGRSLPVRSPDNVAMDPRARSICIATRNGSELLSGGQIATLEAAPDVPPLPPGPTEPDFEDQVLEQLREQTGLLREIRNILDRAHFPLGRPG